MSDAKQKFYLTTPIYYVNARPHIGHAYTTIAADVIARRHRLLGHDTFFLTGTDEHGQKIQRSAEAAGIPPQQFADEVSASFQDLWKRMGITNDAYIRTTDPAHKKGVQKLFTVLQQNGFIELRTYTGQYCISDETFVDVPVGAPCPECGRITETVTEENYFFKLSHFQRQLIDLIESGELAIQPETRRNEVLSFLRGNVNQTTESGAPEPALSLSKGLDSQTSDGAPQNPGAPSLPESHPGKGGNVKPSLDAIAHSAKGTPYVPGALKDLSISRTSFKWGIPVPGNEKHVIYVWLDALANYMTAIGYGSDDPTEQAKFNHYWPADLHLVGKEIIRFHCVYWPAFLLAANLPLPKAITAHGWLLFENDKMSKSKGNIVRTETILDAFGTLCPPPVGPPQLSSFREAGGPAFPPGTPHNPHASGGSTGLQPGEFTTAEKGALAPDLSTAEANSRVKVTLSTPPQLSSFREAGGPAFSPGAPHNPHASGGSTGLQPGEFTTAEKGALAPGLPTEAEWKHEQDLFAADVLRYFLLREIPFGQDGSFSFDALVQRYNSDLANGYGNLVSRTLSMIHKYYGGVVPDPQALDHPEFARTRVRFYMYLIEQRREERAYSEDSEDFESLARSAYLGDVVNFSSFLQTIARLISLTDRFITEEAPWKAREGEREDARERRLATTLYSAVEDIRLITAILYPVIPFSAARVWSLLGIEEPLSTYPLTERWWGEGKPGTKLGPISPIFPRAPKELIQLMNDIEQNNATQKSSKPAGLPQVNADLDASTRKHSEFREMPIASASATASLNKVAETTHPITAHAEAQAPENAQTTPQITIDDFAKIDLRVAQVLVAERIPKADKLLRLEVDLGYERRQILSGIAQWYTPEELIGRRIVVIANLAPRKMRGLESHGMLLAASHGEDGKPVLATFGEDIALGSRLK